VNNSILATTTGGHDLVSVAVNGKGTNIATVSGSHNLVMSSSGTIGAGVIALTANPNLGPLQNNGGLTPTLLPKSTSPVLGAGNLALAPSTDQRGLSRPAGSPSDLGSVQLLGVPTSPPGSPPPGSSPTPKPPPALHTPALLALFDELLHGVETVNGNDTETVIDSIFGISLLESTYDGAGNLMSVTLLGSNITALFEL
jgi:hypothetical protein